MDDGKILNLHAEIGLCQMTNWTFHYIWLYTLDQFLKAWHRPATIISFVAKYNLRDKICKCVIVCSWSTVWYQRRQRLQIWKINGYLMVIWDWNTDILKPFCFVNWIIWFLKYYTWYQFILQNDSTFWEESLIHFKSFLNQYLTASISSKSARNMLLDFSTFISRQL